MKDIIHLACTEAEVYQKSGIVSTQSNDVADPN